MRNTKNQNPAPTSRRRFPDQPVHPRTAMNKGAWTRQHVRRGAR